MIHVFPQCFVLLVATEKRCNRLRNYAPESSCCASRFSLRCATFGKSMLQKISNKRFFTSNDIALTARAGYGIISLNLGYSVTPVLRDGYGPSFNKLSVGLSISGL